MRKFLLFLIMLGLVGYFIWPTRYKEYAPGESPYADQIGPVVSRVDRISKEVWVKDAAGQWKQVSVRRPELLRPDITGPTPTTQPDTRPAQRQMREAENVQKKTDEMTRSATEQAKPVGQ